MTKKIFFFITLVSVGTLVSAVPLTVDTTHTVVDTVMVPVKILKLTSVTGSGASMVSNYSGQVTYNLHIGGNDSLNVGLSFVPVGGGTTIVPTWDSGMVGPMGFVNGINGKNRIYFRCSITGTPAASYTACITMNDTLSHIMFTTDSLLYLMTTQNKDDQLHGTGSARMSPDIASLGIPGYYMSNGTSSACHGATVGGSSTGFPTPIAMASTFDTALIDSEGIVLAEEFYAKGIYIAEGPMVNTVRDPRGGRDWETFGEDPYLSGMIAASYSKGVQSLKCVNMPKHLICNDMENNRGSYSANVSERTLREIYAMPWEYAIKQGKAYSVMSAMNEVNGTYCSQNPHTLTDILKKDFGFRGFVVCDMGSLHSTPLAANAGEDVELESSSYFGSTLISAVTANTVSMARLNDMARRILQLKVWAGLIGKVGLSAVTQYASLLNDAAHQALCLKVAQESITLVKNAKFGTETTPTLPLSKSDTVALVGPYYTVGRTSADHSSGEECAFDTISFLQGVTAELPPGHVLDSSHWRNANVVIACLGVSGEGEGSDRTTATLEPPSGQIALVNAILAAGKKCVVVMTGGSAAVGDVWDSVSAVVVAWYPGEKQGTALAQILFGDVNPSGKLSASWPASLSQLPPFSSANNVVPYERADTGRGYRYYDRCNLTPLYPFGYGLSYTTFKYSNLTITPNPAFVGQDIVVTATIQNTGADSGAEVPQLYVSDLAPPLPRPVKELRGFARVCLAAGASTTVSFALHEREFAYFDTTAASVTSWAPYGQFVTHPGNYAIKVGPSSATLPLSGTLTLQ